MLHRTPVEITQIVPALGLTSVRPPIRTGQHRTVPNTVDIAETVTTYLYDLLFSTEKTKKMLLNTGF